MSTNLREPVFVAASHDIDSFTAPSCQILGQVLRVEAIGNIFGPLSGFKLVALRLKTSLFKHISNILSLSGTNSGLGTL